MGKRKPSKVRIWTKKPITNRILRGTIVYGNERQAQNVYRDNIIAVDTDEEHLKEIGHIIAGYEVIKIIEFGT